MFIPLYTVWYLATCSSRSRVAQIVLSSNRPCRRCRFRQRLICLALTAIWVVTGVARTTSLSCTTWRCGHLRANGEMALLPPPRLDAAVGTPTDADGTTAFCCRQLRLAHRRVTKAVRRAAHLHHLALVQRHARPSRARRGRPLRAAAEGADDATPTSATSAAYTQPTPFILPLSLLFVGVAPSSHSSPSAALFSVRERKSSLHDAQPTASASSKRTRTTPLPTTQSRRCHSARCPARRTCTSACSTASRCQPRRRPHAVAIRCLTVSCSHHGAVLLHPPSPSPSTPLRPHPHSPRCCSPATASCCYSSRARWRGRRRRPPAARRARTGVIAKAWASGALWSSAPPWAIVVAAMDLMDGDRHGCDYAHAFGMASALRSLRMQPVTPPPSSPTASRHRHRWPARGATPRRRRPAAAARPAGALIGCPTGATPSASRSLDKQRWRRDGDGARGHGGGIEPPLGECARGRARASLAAWLVDGARYRRRLCRGVRSATSAHLPPRWGRSSTCRPRSMIGGGSHAGGAGRPSARRAGLLPWWVWRQLLAWGTLCLGYEDASSSMLSRAVPARVHRNTVIHGAIARLVSIDPHARPRPSRQRPRHGHLSRRQRVAPARRRRSPTPAPSTPKRSSTPERSRWLLHSFATTPNSCMAARARPPDG